MIPRELQVVVIAFGLICSGCRQQNTPALSAAEQHDPAVVESRQKDGQASPIHAEKKNLDEDTDEPTVIAYYFHPTIRCIACITVESIAAETIEEAFREQLADGRLVWMRINIDEKHSEDYEKQFEVSGSALVITKLDDGNNMQYKKLTKVWELLSQPQALSEYIKNEINEYLSQ
jgi:hypothetical protein